MDYSRDQLVEEVKRHATKNYNRGGWDYVVECYSDDEIRDAIGKAKTVHGAITNVATKFAIKLVSEVRADIRGA